MKQKQKCYKNIIPHNVISTVGSVAPGTPFLPYVVISTEGISPSRVYLSVFKKKSNRLYDYSLIAIFFILFHIPYTAVSLPKGCSKA